MLVDVISVDPGLNQTGVFMVIDKKPISARFERIHQGGRYASLGQLFFWLRQQVEYQRPNLPRLAFVEDYPYHMKSSASLTICAEAGGVVRAALGSMGISVVAVNPSTWKRLTIGDRPKDNKDDQANYLAAVHHKYGLTFETVDEADAYLIYRAAQLIYQGEGGDGKQVKLVRSMIDEALQLKLLNEATA